MHPYSSCRLHPSEYYERPRHIARKGTMLTGKVTFLSCVSLILASANSFDVSPRVVFACKSNSCRSQMAEGWAREWISQQKQVLEHLFETGGGNGDLQRRQSVLNDMVITSVALDSTAVFCGDAPETRKTVKGKAVEAMLLDGIDISQYAPKSLPEIIPILDRSAADVAAEAEEKIVDRLVILCACGDEVKRALVERSKHTDEWDIPAPTAAAKAGEGDAAYRRVSLQIRDEVNKLMGELCP